MTSISRATTGHSKLLFVTGFVWAVIGSWSSLSYAATTATATPTATTTPAAIALAASKERSRLDALFIWKTSEELKLDAQTEQKFTDVIESLNARRRAANLKMDEALTLLSHAKSKAQAEKALNSHRQALREIQATQSAEVDRLRPLLGPEKLAQYITVKNSILEKLKTMLAAPAATPAATSNPASTAAPAGAPAK